MGRRSGPIQTQTSSVCESQMLSRNRQRLSKRVPVDLSGHNCVSVSDEVKKDAVGCSHVAECSAFMKAPLATFTVFYPFFGSHLSEMWFKAHPEASAHRRIRMDKVNLDLPQDLLTYSSITCILR